MNPTITVQYLEKQRKKGDHYFNREYGAEYTSSENSYLDPKAVETCQLMGLIKCKSVTNGRVAPPPA